MDSFKVKGFGIEIITSVNNNLKAAAEEQRTPIDENRFSLVLHRAERASVILKGKKILWLDDNPQNNINIINLFETIGLKVGRVVNDDDAFAELTSQNYDILISDIKRGNVANAGVLFLKKLRTANIQIPTVFYLSDLKPELGTPAYAFGITNRPEELLHFVIDIAERKPNKSVL